MTENVSLRNERKLVLRRTSLSENIALLARSSEVGILLVDVSAGLIVCLLELVGLNLPSSVTFVILLK